jgi:hypothetical protein
MEGLGIFYGHLVNFMDIWSYSWTFGQLYGYLANFMDIWSILWILDNSMDIWSILWIFGIFCGNMLYTFPVLVCCTKKIWQP